MSYKSQAWVWEKRGIGSYGKLVLLELHDHLGRHGAVAWPSLRTIAERTGMSKSTVRRVLTDLERRGLIAGFEMVGDRGTTSSVYLLNLEDLEPSDFVPHALRAARAVTGAFLRPRIEAQKEARRRHRARMAHEAPGYVEGALPG